MYKLKVITPFLYLKGIMSLEYIRRNGLQKIQADLLLLEVKAKLRTNNKDSTQPMEVRTKKFGTHSSERVQRKSEESRSRIREYL